MLYIFYFRSCKAVLLKMVFATQQYVIALSEIKSYFSIMSNYFFLNINIEKHVFLWWKLVVKNSGFFLTSDILDFLGHVVLLGQQQRKNCLILVG